MTTIQEIDACILSNEEEIQARIQASKKEIQSLKTQRNALTHLCAIPVELLVRILRKYCSDRDLLVVNSMCKGLKQITDNEHILWSTPPLDYGTPEQITKLFIRRSGSAPLAFSTGANRQIDVIIPHLYQTKSLKVSVHIPATAPRHFNWSQRRGRSADDASFTALMDSLHKTSTEYMERLSLGGSYDAIRPREIKILEIKSSLCGGNPRRLITLSLSDVHIQGMPNASFLQHFNLYRAKCEYETLRSYFLMLKQLRTLNITTLQLENSDIHVAEPVELPHLQRLELNVGISCLSTLVDLLPDPQVFLQVNVSRLTGREAAPTLNDPRLQKVLSRQERFGEKSMAIPAFRISNAVSNSISIGLLAIDIASRSAVLKLP